MKQLYTILGALLFVIVFGASSLAIYSWYQASQHKATAVPYIKMVLPEISKWDPEIIKDYMAPEALETTSEERIVNIVKYLSKLGALKKMEEPSFSNVFSDTTVAGAKITLVTYTIDAEYEKGDAAITLDLLETGDSLQVYKFNFNSMALAE